MQALAADLIRRPVAVIVADSNAALAAKAATTTIPIVFGSGGDPVGSGLVASLNRPGGNVTGVSFLAGVLGAKRLELLRQLVPKATKNCRAGEPGHSHVRGRAKRRAGRGAIARAAAHRCRRQQRPRHRDRFCNIRPARDWCAAGRLRSFLDLASGTLVALAARHALPAIYNQREVVAAGGLMSYGTSITDAYRQAGIYAGRILKGEKPADLPVMQSSKFELVINLKTAKALGLEFRTSCSPSPTR